MKKKSLLKLAILGLTAGMVLTACNPQVGQDKKDAGKKMQDKQNQGKGSCGKNGCGKTCSK